MKQTGRWPSPAANRRYGLTIFATLMSIILLGMAIAPVAGQTPVADGEQATQDPVVTPTPVVGSTSGQLQPPPATAPAAETSQDEAQDETEPAQQTTGPVNTTDNGDLGLPVLAQGLIYLSGGDVIWQVREVDLVDAETITGNARIIMQRSGVSIVRNDVTGKRARLEPGEAYFAAAGDPYSLMADEGSDSVVWVFEISNTNDVGEGAFYLSPDVSGYGEAVYDFEFVRNVLSAGESAQFEGGVGPSLLVVLSGNIEVTDAEGTAALTTSDGLMVDGNATIDAGGDGQAVYVTLTVGPEVSDASAALPQAAETPAPVDDGAAAPAETVEEFPDEGSAPPASDAQPGEYVTSIAVSAIEGISVSIYADGALAFEGWLGPGESTDFINGSVFEVYTTSGVNTAFTNSCGTDPFLMGYEPGDAYYYLEATESSCAPIG